MAELIKSYYSPSDTYEDFDPETGTFYNASGDQLRDPDEYDVNTEGYIPWGDE